MFYKQLPDSVDAVQWRGDNLESIMELTECECWRLDESKSVAIEFSDSQIIIVNPLDWVCLGSDIRWYVLKDYQFKEIYHANWEKKKQ